MFCNLWCRVLIAIGVAGKLISAPEEIACQNNFNVLAHRGLPKDMHFSLAHNSKLTVH